MATAAAAISDFGSSTELGRVPVAVAAAFDDIIGGSVDCSVAADCEAVAAFIRSSSSFGTSASEGRYSSGNTEKEKKERVSGDSERG